MMSLLVIYWPMSSSWVLSLELLQYVLVPILFYHILCVRNELILKGDPFDIIKAALVFLLTLWPSSFGWLKIYCDHVAFHVDMFDGGGCCDHNCLG